MDRRGFLQAVAAVLGTTLVPMSAVAEGAAPTVFGLESLGFSESITWNSQFAAWLISLKKDIGGRLFAYERLMEDDPRKQPEAILSFYRDDALCAFELAAKKGETTRG